MLVTAGSCLKSRTPSIGSMPEAPALTTGIEDEEIYMALVPVRPESAVREDYEAARARQAASDVRLEEARALAARASARIDLKKKDLEMLDIRLKDAKQRKAEAEKEDLERQKDEGKLELSYIERREDLRKAEIEMLRSEAEEARAAARVHERELELADVREQRAEVIVKAASEPSSAGRLVDLDRKLREHEMDTLQAMRDHAGKRKDAADRQRRVVEAMLDVFEARSKILAFRS